MTPREVALRILEGRFAAPPSSGAVGDLEVCELVDFQAEGVARVRALLQRRGGAVLADSVGLGKTYMALALIEETLRAAGDVVVVAPAAMRAIWRRALGRVPEVGGGWRLLSHTQLARGARVRPAPARGYRLVVVDEAHRFRNRATLRYAALARLVGGRHDGSGRVRCLLLTATPVNNRAQDLLHLIRLFAADDAFQDVGVPSLRDAFMAAAESDAANDGGVGAGSPRLTAVVRATVVRRTRAMVRDRFDRSMGTADGGRRPRFPARAPPRRVRYLDPALPRLVARLGELELAPYSPPALIRLGLLKRLDSSPAAFRASLQRLDRVLRLTLDAARAGRLLAPGPGASVLPSGDSDPLQLTLIEVVARPAPPDVDLDALARSVERDVERVRELARLRGQPGAVARDAKLLALRAVLRETRGEKTLVFTEYRDTAAALWRGLSGRHRVARVDGSGAWLGQRPAGRRAVVERFAPRANGRRPPPDRERVDVLIATDVLAEGLNLQDARHVISYELPWNPVRLLQRIGRVDRLGSPHTEVVPHLFVPDDGLEAMLGLTRRVRSKLGQIATTVGAEQADELLERLAEPAPMSHAAAVAVGSALERAEAGPSDPVEELRTLWVRNRPSGDRRPGPSIAHGGVAVPRGSAAARIAWVVLVDRTGKPTILEIGHDGVVADAGASAVAALTRALDGQAAVGPRSSLPLDAIENHLARTTALVQAPARLSHHDPGLRLMRRLRRTMARAGATLDPGVVARADALLERVTMPLDPAHEESVRAILDSTDDPPLATLLNAAETALGHPPGNGNRGGLDEPAVTILAALEIHVCRTPRAVDCPGGER